MSDIDRAELRRLLAEATPGPWGVKVRFGLSYIPQVLVSKWVPVPRKDAEGYLVGIKHEPDVLFVGQDADVPLIAAAVNALPGLLDALEKAEAHRDSLAAKLDDEAVIGDE